MLQLFWHVSHLAANVTWGGTELLLANAPVSPCLCTRLFVTAVPQGAFLDPQGPTIVHTVIWAGSAAIVEEHTSAWLLFTGKVHWKDARDRCQGLQGDLTTLGKQIDIDRLVSWMIRLGVNEVWIGLTTKPGLGNLVSLDPADWFWMSTGATPAPKLDAWLRSSAGRMYPSKFYENCTSLVAASKAWQNNMCDPAKGAVQRAFVCEIPY